MPTIDIRTLAKDTTTVPPEDDATHATRLIGVATKLNGDLEDAEVTIGAREHTISVRNQELQTLQRQALIAGLLAFLFLVVVVWLFATRSTEEDVQKRVDQKVLPIATEHQALVRDRDDARAKAAVCEAKQVTPSAAAQPSDTGTNSPIYQFNLGEKIGKLDERTTHIGNGVDRLLEGARPRQNQPQPAVTGGGNPSPKPKAGKAPPKESSQGGVSCKVFDKDGKTVLADFLANGPINPLGKPVITGDECNTARTEWTAKKGFKVLEHQVLERK